MKRSAVRIIYAAAPLALSLMLATSAFAQLENQTGIADPGRASEQFEQQMDVPQVTPDINIKHMELVSAPAGADKIVFKFGGLHVTGNSVYSEAELASIYKGRIGETVTLADVYSMANDMTLKYRNDGYILTQVVVPPQTIEGGIAKVQVVEGFIDKIVVQPGPGEGDYAIQNIKQYAGQINKGGPANVKVLERELLIINDLPGVKARSILSPSKTTPGAADLLIIVERKPYDAQISVDNFGSRYLGPSQLTGAGTLNSIFGLNDAITAQVVTAPIQLWDDNELGYQSLSYEMPVGPWGTKLSALMSITNTEPGFDLRDFDVHGRSQLVQVKATHPFIRARSTNLYGRLLFDARDVKSKNNIEVAREDHIRALRAGARFEFLDQILGVGFNVVDLEVSKGLNIMNSSDEGDLNMTRDLADPHAVKAELALQRLHRITESVNLLIEGHAQLSSNALLSSEEMGVGGVSNGRGYDPSEIVGDDGVSGRLELQWKNPGNLHAGTQFVEKYQLYGFYDIGKVWNDDASTADDDESLASAGFGVRAGFQSGFNGGLGIAFPLTREVQTRDDHSPKVYMNLNKTF